MESFSYRNRIVPFLEQAGLRKYEEINFRKNHTAIDGSARTRLVLGTLSMENGEERVVLKTLCAAYAYKKKRGNETKDYIDKLLAYFEREVDVCLRVSNHPNVVRLMGFMPAFENGLFPAIIIPYYPCGSLRSLVCRGSIGEVEKLSLLRDVADGLAHLHNYGIVHRDLKAGNVLVESIDETNGTRRIAKINDFGSAKLLHPALGRIATSTRTNSLAWSPPEYLSCGPHDNSYSSPKPGGDIWSFGCTFVEVFTGMDPWNRSDDVEEKLRRKKCPPFPAGLRTMYKEDFIKLCWKINPDHRISAREAEFRLRSMIYSLTHA